MIVLKVDIVDAIAIVLLFGFALFVCAAIVIDKVKGKLNKKKKGNEE